MDIFTRLKELTAWIPGKDLIRPLYLPLIRKIRYSKDNRRFQAGGLDVLLTAKQALDAANVHFWPDFGTLLGITRDGALIKHDTDVDIAVFYADFGPHIRKALQDNGFELKHEISVDGGKFAMEESYVWNGIGLDIFYYHRHEGKMWCHLFPPLGNGKRAVREIEMTYSGFADYPFAGTTWSVPKDFEQRLIDTYGKNYRIPDPEWYTPDDALNSRLVEKTVTEKTY